VDDRENKSHSEESGEKVDLAILYSVREAYQVLVS